MATCDLDESNIVPKDFHLSSSSGSVSRSIPNRRRCPLCRKFRKSFYCKDCICTGLYCSSNIQATEGYINKQRGLLELRELRKILEKNCLKILEVKLKTDILYSKIRQSNDRNKILKLVLEEKTKRKALINAKLIELTVNNDKRKFSLPKYEHKVQELENYVAGRREKVVMSLEISKEKQDEIRKLVKIRIQQLFKFIFPICKVNPAKEIETGDDMVNALAEASRTTYIRDRWEYNDYSGEWQYCVVAPTLPHSGNYLSYNVWDAQNEDSFSGSNSALIVDHNPAFSISAALTYTAQLVHVLSFYLCVRLPYKMFYSDFCSNDMTEKQFIRRVAKLNANVLYLCFSQNVNSHYLRSCETIHNILQLIEDENSDLGRQGPITVDFHHAYTLEQPLSVDLKINDVSDSEEGDSFQTEWETDHPKYDNSDTQRPIEDSLFGELVAIRNTDQVPHVYCPEIAAGPANIQSPQTISTQQASSMAGGLVNSAAASLASMWRGITGR